MRSNKKRSKAYVNNLNFFYFEDIHVCLFCAVFLPKITRSHVVHFKICFKVANLKDYPFTEQHIFHEVKAWKNMCLY